MNSPREQVFFFFLLFFTSIFRSISRKRGCLALYGSPVSSLLAKIVLCQTTYKGRLIWSVRRKSPFYRCLLPPVVQWGAYFSTHKESERRTTFPTSLNTSKTRQLSILSIFSLGATARFCNSRLPLLGTPSGLYKADIRDNMCHCRQEMTRSETGYVRDGET